MGVMGRKVAAAAVVLVVAMSGAIGPPAAGDHLPFSPTGWTQEVYRDLLDRDPTPAQLAHRVAQLEAGVPRRVIADALVGSRERALLLVDELFERVLGRPADPDAKAYWADRLTSGTAESTFASFVYGSPELYARAGGTPEAYVALLYREVLAREPDAAGAAYWAARVAAGENRTGLARAWYLSAEATGLRIGVHFMDLLGGPPTPAERADWAGRLRRYDRRRIEAALVARGAGYLSPTVLVTEEGSGREPSISADGRIVAFTSPADDLTPAGSRPFDDIFVLDRRSGRLRAITDGNGHSGAPEVSADGSTVVFQSAATNLGPGEENGQVNVFRASTAGGPIEQLSDGEVASTGPMVSGDGSVVAFVAAGEVVVHTGGPGEEAVVERVDGFAPALAAGGGALVYRAGAHAYLARLPLGPDPEPVQLDEAGATSTVTVSADGRRAAYLREAELPNGAPVARLVLADLDDGGAVTRTDTMVQDDALRFPRIADDGSAVLFEQYIPLGGSISDLILDLEGGSIPVGIYPQGSDLTGDGGLVVGGDWGEVKLYDPRAGMVW